jgi:hypothetical protein
MNERREFYRVSTFARVGLRLVDASRERAVRLQIRARGAPDGTEVLDDSRLENEQRAIIGLLQRVAFSMDRVEHRLEEIISHQRGLDAFRPLGADPVEIDLSGNGLCARFEKGLPIDTLAEATLDIREAGLPLIYAMVRVVRVEEIGRETAMALEFEEITPEDLQRIVQFTIRTQRQELRETLEER